MSGDEQRVERYRRMIGVLTGSVLVAGTMPSHLPDVPVTHVQAGEGAIRLYWLGGKLLGLAEGDPDAVYSVTFAPADGAYVAYDLHAERAVGIEFDTSGLTLTRDGATVRAERL